MSPILVRPVREQLEHDRVIRLLQAKYKRKFDVAINPGNEQTSPVGTGPSAWYPDLVLQSADRRKLLGVVEVETAESVNHLEAMSQWAAFTRFRVPFHLYVPVGSVDTARRFCADMHIPADEIWAYQAVGDQLRFTLVHRGGQSPAPKARAAEPAEPARPRAAAASRRTPGNGNPSSTRRQAPARGRAGGSSVSRAARPPAAGPARRAAAKAKTAPRRPAAKAAKRKTGAPSRAAKRR